MRSVSSLNWSRARCASWISLRSCCSIDNSARCPAMKLPLLTSLELQWPLVYYAKEEKSRSTTPSSPTTSSRASQSSLSQPAQRQQSPLSPRAVLPRPLEDAGAAQIPCPYPVQVYAARKRHVSGVFARQQAPSEQKSPVENRYSGQDLY